MIFPLITFPYVARILSAAGIGRVEFAASFIQYFIMISQVGIPIYAIRECARRRDDKGGLSKTFQEIVTINAIMVAIAYVCLAIVVLSIGKLQNYRSLLLLMSISIVTTNMGIDWLYQAIEQYKYITFRGSMIMILGLISMFIFVKHQNDYMVYAAITVFSVAVGDIYNFIHARKYVSIFRVYRDYNFKRHIKPITTLFVMAISVTLYLNTDKVMLGFISGDNSVGLYTAAMKMVKLVATVITALSVVLLPRMSYYVDHRRKTDIGILISKSLDLILMISIPATIGITMVSKQIIMLLAGGDYEGAVQTLNVLAFVIVPIGLSNLIGVQILVAHDKERDTLISTIIGAVINIAFNIFLIPRFHQNGAAISTLIAESFVTIVQIKLAQPYLKNRLQWRNLRDYIYGTGLIVVLCGLINHSVHSSAWSLGIIIFVSVGTYFGFLYIRRNELVYELLSKASRQTMLRRI